MKKYYSIIFKSKIMVTIEIEKNPKLEKISIKFTKEGIEITLKERAAKSRRHHGKKRRGRRSKSETQMDTELNDYFERDYSTLDNLTPIILQARSD